MLFIYITLLTQRLGNHWPASRFSQHASDQGHATEDMMAKKKEEQKVDGAHRTVTPSAELAVIIGKDPRPRTEVTSKVWEYIKKNDLQDPKDGREIVPDEALAKVLGSKKINMFAMTKAVSKHLS
jgi:upstream activation factor subunit UAF30